MTNLRSSKHDIRRTRWGIARSKDDDLYLNYLVSGVSNMSQRNQTKKVPAHHFVILDNSQEFNICHQSNSGIAALVVRLRRSEMSDYGSSGLFDLDNNFRSHRLMPVLRMNLAELALAGKTISDEEVTLFR